MKEEFDTYEKAVSRMNKIDCEGYLNNFDFCPVVKGTCNRNCHAWVPYFVAKHHTTDMFYLDGNRCIHPEIVNIIRLKEKALQNAVIAKEQSPQRIVVQNRVDVSDAYKNACGLQIKTEEK